MNFPVLRLSCLFLHCALTFGCSETQSEADAAASDTAPLDAPSALDTPIALDAAGDAATGDAPSAMDAGEGPRDAGLDANAPMTDAGGCEYTALDEVIVECEGTPTFVSRIGVFPPSDACPEHWVVGSRPTHYDSAAEAIASESCDAGCEWHFSTSVTRLYCGRRTGYEVLRAESEGCEDLYRFDDGYYPSVEAYDETHPCP